jgi:hypothetical protein
MKMGARNAKLDQFALLGSFEDEADNALYTVCQRHGAGQVWFCHCTPSVLGQSMVSQERRRVGKNQRLLWEVPWGTMTTADRPCDCIHVQTLQA